MPKPLYQLDWQRQEQPVLSAMTTDEDWCNVQLYNPTVVRHGNRYLMWYVGNSSAARVSDMESGLAESDDGIHFTPHPGNPILRQEDLPAGTCWQTPHVMFDPDEDRFKMWFIMSAGEWDPETGGVTIDMHDLGFATSSDGLAWEVHPEPLYAGGRRPCVIKDGPGAYRMWMGAAPDWKDAEVTDAVFRFVSTDGLAWKRDPEPVITAEDDDRIGSVVYPFVLQTEDGYVMWYSCHVAGGIFEVFASTSDDGLAWTHHLDTPALPATRDRNDYDGRYTSTPCVLDDGDRYLMYYCTRDWGNLYRTGDGTIRTDSEGIYRHIGVATVAKDRL